MVSSSGYDFQPLIVLKDVTEFATVITSLKRMENLQILASIKMVL